MRSLGSLSACALLVAMFLPWYEIHGGALGRLVLASRGKPIPPEGDAWEALGSVRFLLFGLVLVALLPAAFAATHQPAAAGRAARIVLASAVATGLVVLYRIVDQPGDDAFVDVRWGAYFGLAAVCAIGLGAWAQTRGGVPARDLVDGRTAGGLVEAARRPGPAATVALLGVALCAAFVAF